MDVENSPEKDPVIWQKIELLKKYKFDVVGEFLSDVTKEKSPEFLEMVYKKALKLVEADDEDKHFQYMLNEVYRSNRPEDAIRGYLFGHEIELFIERQIKIRSVPGLEEKIKRLINY